MTTVLIVEDNELNAKVFRIIVQSLDHVVLEACNGEEGILQAKKHHPDLILMDVQMPVMDGITAFNILKSDSSTKDIPVIALTSYAMKEDEERIRQAGFVDYLTKPIRKDTFIVHIQSALERKTGLAKSEHPRAIF